MKIEAYTTGDCSYCDHLKELLLRANLKDITTFIKVGRDITREEFIEKFPDANGYPYVIIDGEHLPGLVPAARYLVQHNLIKSGQRIDPERTRKVIQTELHHNHGRIVGKVTPLTEQNGDK